MSKDTFPEDLQLLWENTAQKFSCDLLTCDQEIDICELAEEAISIEIEHPKTHVRKYLWFCCSDHKEEAFKLWPILEKQQVRFF